MGMVADSARPFGIAASSCGHVCSLSGGAGTSCPAGSLPAIRTSVPSVAGRRMSESCSEAGRPSSSGGYCCRRKQLSPRRSPLL